jgi:hypothetical protein
MLIFKSSKTAERVNHGIIVGIPAQKESKPAISNIPLSVEKIDLYCIGCSQLEVIEVSKSKNKQE